MGDEVFISIITVSYNSGATIGRTIESILKQDFKDYEYIIQDGGSIDNTREIINKYESSFDGRVKTYFEPDEGIYDAMNKAIKKAKGKYIWLVNADDYISDNALRYIFDYCKKQNFKECIISGRMNVFDAETSRIKFVSSQGAYDEYTDKCRKLKMGICHPATIVHKNIYQRLGLYDARYYISADIDFCLRAYEAGVLVEFPSVILTNMSDGGISNKFPLRKNMHDCKLRASKFCRSFPHRMYYITWYFFRLLYLKFYGYRY